MTILYLTTWDFTDEISDGVCKKIKAQIHVFESNGLNVDFVYIKNGYVIYREDGTERRLFTVGQIKKTPVYIKLFQYIKQKRYNWVYNRYGMMDSFYYRVLRCLRKNGAHILLEIPTYPYKGENPGGFLYSCMFLWDDLYIKRLKKIVDKIVTYSDDEKIYGIETIRVINGIDISDVEPITVNKGDNKVIDLLIVAIMQKHHGYERLIKGLKYYEENGGQREVVCHFVGDGPEKLHYMELAKALNMKDNILFYGMKSGKELNNIYENADIGVTAMGLYKDGINLSSELKSREYLAKGLPILAGCPVDILHGKELFFYHEIPNDESLIDMRDVISFYDMVYQNGRENVRKLIRKYAEENVDMSKAMNKVIRYMIGKTLI